MTEKEALQWIAELFEESQDNITAETKREAIAAWDSLGTLTLLAALDEHFDIRLSDEEIQQLRGVSDILGVLKRYENLS